MGLSSDEGKHYFGQTSVNTRHSKFNNPTGHEKKVQPSHRGQAHFPFWASNSSFLLAQWAQKQGSSLI